MRCLSCQNLSVDIICKQCQKIFLKPIFKKRVLEDTLEVYSFYEYEEIKEYINTKYEFYGDRVFNILASLSFKKFSSNFSFLEKVYAISIDDITSHEFSQSAILSKHLKSNYIEPLYSKLLSKNKIKYAGKSLEFRKNNKRNFIYKGKKNLKVILVDDIVTSGSTLLEAKKVLEKSACEILFALTLSDAKIC